MSRIRTTVVVIVAGASILVGASSSGAPSGSPTISPTAIRRLPLPGAPPTDAGAKPTPTTPAGSVAIVTLTGAQKSAVVQQMNDLRATLGAASMQTLTWDDNLAAFATNMAGLCELTHSSSTVRSQIQGWVGTYVGENLAAGTGVSIADATNATKIQSSLQQGINNWWAEKAFYTYATNTCQAGQTCGHFTQVAWASTKAVGCGLAMCNPQKTLNMPGYTMYCNFGPGGNQSGKKPW